MKITDAQVTKIGNEIFPYASLYTWWLWLRSEGIIDQCNQCNEAFHLRFQLLYGFADLRVVIHIAVTNYAVPVTGFSRERRLVVVCVRRLGAIPRKYQGDHCKETKHRVHFQFLLTPLCIKTDWCA